MALTRWTLPWALVGSLGAGAAAGAAFGGDGPDLAQLEKDFGAGVQPLLEQYCLGCHSTEKQKGDLDLERFSSLALVLKDPKPWQGMVEQLTLGEMPPKEKPQPTAAEREKLLGWANAALDAAALARAGDPGPVVLRRLNNAEYTYTVRDLTGVESLDPVREFPADSAAGEGFMNTGNALVMSPALLSKYLDAGKDVASHAVLLPDGFAFSPSTTRRDWTEELLAEIRELYRRYTDPRGADQVNLQGIVFDTNEGGRLPLEKYLEATLEAREAGDGDAGGGAGAGERLERVAAERGLSARYLRSLLALLRSEQRSPLLDGWRARWRSAKPGDGAVLAVAIAPWQKALWKFSSVGHIGKVGGPQGWMEPVSPLVGRQDFRLKLAAPPDASEVVVYLVAGDAGDGSEGDLVVWERPRLVVPGRPDLLLRDARSHIAAMTARRERVFAATARCLAAAAEASADPGAAADVGALATRHGVDVESLGAWLDYLGIGTSAEIRLDHLTQQIHKASGYDFVNGWGTNETPNVVASSSDQHVRIPGNLKPHGVAMHPSPKLNVAAGWRSPIAGAVVVSAAVTHAHPECGNGVEWFLELRRGATRQRLATGVAHGAKEVKAGPLENIAVQKGDLVSLLVGPRNGDHSCDLTDVELVLTSAGEGGREWSLTRDVSPSVLAGNPHADSLGNEGVWCFYTEPIAGGSTGPVIPAGSLLARWQAASDAGEKQKLAEAAQALLLSGPPAARDSPDAALYRQLASLGGPLFAGARPVSPGDGSPRASEAPAWSLDPELFGKHPQGSAVDPASLCVAAPSVHEIRLPADLVSGAELVTGGELSATDGGEGSVQLQVTPTRPASGSGLAVAEATVTEKSGPWTGSGRQISHTSPIVVREGTAARQRFEAAFEEVRQWFPAALCYVKIVPVDEVVTLTLYHREDHHLVRLMLDEAQAARLDQLWDRLHFVSHDALTLVDAFEQLWQYATQDADPKVFEPMRKPINDRAAAFRQRLADTEPRHVDALIDLAALAYRRPLGAGEQQELRGLYRRLREQELSHEEAFRLTLARVFVAPAFLYRLETAPPGPSPGPVTDWELASRLSYFLWSSAPDPELREAAASGRLRQPEVLLAQTRRMLRDPRVRRLAIEFGCAWLHVHGFDQLDEKSERHFPTFAGLRGAMYEEVIRYLTDAFQNDGSALSLFASDHAILNEELARHYGIPGVTGPEWRRVDGVQKLGRGGVLGFAATLAKQSGASRTSPILRGNWIAEVLLGDKLPRPPKGVPPLPEDEATETLTMRQLTEKHSSDERCSGCHARIDGYGFALEGYDAIGRSRTKDLGDRPIDTRARVFDGTEVDGAASLRAYLLSAKRDVLLGQLCRKLLGYALGRGVLLSDKPLLAAVQRQLRENEYRLSAAVIAIVQSRQFQEIRGRDAVSDEESTQ